MKPIDGAADLAFASIAALSRRVRTGELSPLDLTEACLARIAAFSKLGCFAALAAERARAEARAAAVELSAGRWRGPLHGIPFGLADAIDARAVPTGLGVAALAGRVLPERDATVAARLADQGAVLVGKLQIFPPAAAHGAGGAPAGAVRSPWDPALPAGAPSPGPAAAVAAGLVPFAIGVHGTEPDTAAGECGVTALRPTYGVLPRSGAVLGSFTLAALGLVARSAEDCALVLDALAGSDPRDPSSIGAPRGIGRLAAELPKGLRIGIVEQPAPGPEAREAWAGVQEALRAAGALLQPASLPELPWASIAGVLAGAEATVLCEDVLGIAVPGATAGAASAASAADYVRAARGRSEAQRALARLLERHDLLLAPAPRPGASSETFAAAIALGGLPALSFPIGLAGARPLAATLVAPPLEEARLLSAVLALQARTSHHLHRPPGAAVPAEVASVTRP